jgi:hypothetical protein
MVEDSMGETTVRIDLQDIYRANPKAFIAASAVIAAAFAFLVVKGVSSGGSSSAKSQPAAHVTTTTSSSSSSTVASSGVTAPNPNYHPIYQNVPQTPALQAIETKLGGLPPQAAAAAEVVTPPSPAWSTAYPAVSANVVSDATGYAVAFAQKLLDRNYARESRGALLAWTQAEAAAELLPGIPDAVAPKGLYISLADPALADLTASPVPPARQWSDNAAAGVRQTAYSVVASPDAEWSQLVSEGFQSKDPLMTMYDVTGLLSTTTHSRTTKQHFTLILGLGSALHHKGFGAFSVAQWELSG